MLLIYSWMFTFECHDSQQSHIEVLLLPSASRAKENFTCDIQYLQEACNGYIFIIDMKHVLSFLQMLLILDDDDRKVESLLCLMVILMVVFWCGVPFVEKHQVWDYCMERSSESICRWFWACHLKVAILLGFHFGCSGHVWCKYCHWMVTMWHFTVIILVSIWCLQMVVGAVGDCTVLQHNTMILQSFFLFAPRKNI